MSDNSVIVKLVNEENHCSYDITDTHNSLDYLIYYIYRAEKTWIDSYRKQSFTTDFTGCEPFWWYSKNYEHDPDKVLELMNLNNQIVRPHCNIDLAKHRIISFRASEEILPKDIDHIARKVACFYSDYGFICCYGIHCDGPMLHIHLAVDNYSYRTGNKLNISFEKIKLLQISRRLLEEHRDRLISDLEYRRWHENMLYGDGCLIYGQTPLSIQEQIKQTI